MAEKKKVGKLRRHGDPGGQHVHEAVESPLGQLIEIGGAGRLKGGQAPQGRDRSVGNPVQDEKEGLYHGRLRFEPR